MKIHKRVVQGIDIRAYNDSNSEWVVYSEASECGQQRFDKRKFTMAHAMEFYADTVKIFEGQGG